MVKFVDLGVLYFSLVLPRQATWLAAGPEWILRSLGGVESWAYAEADECFARNLCQRTFRLWASLWASSAEADECFELFDTIR